MIIAFKVIVQI